MQQITKPMHYNCWSQALEPIFPRREVTSIRRPVTTARESPRVERKTQHSLKKKKNRFRQQLMARWPDEYRVRWKTEIHHQFFLIFYLKKCGVHFLADFFTFFKVLQFIRKIVTFLSTTRPFTFKFLSLKTKEYFVSGDHSVGILKGMLWNLATEESFLVLVKPLVSWDGWTSFLSSWP